MDVIPGNYPLTIRPGTAWSKQFQLRDAAGDPVDVSSYGTFTAQIRPTPGSVTLIAELTVDETDAATGILVISGAAADTDGQTGKAAWDVIDSDGHPWVEGIVTFKPTVSELP